MGEQQTEAVRRGYRGPRLSLAELLDELIAEGRSRPQACAEVMRATDDGAIVWIDPHPNPRAYEEVVKSITQIAQSYMNWRPNTRVSIIPLPESVDYVRRLWVMRAQCQAVFGLPAAALECSITGAGPRSKAGHPEEIDWEEAELFAMQTLEGRGDPQDPKNKMPGWRSQEDLVRAVVMHLNPQPDPSTVRRRAPDWLKKFREQKSAHN